MLRFQNPRLWLPSSGFLEILACRSSFFFINKETRVKSKSRDIVIQYKLISVTELIVFQITIHVGYGYYRLYRHLSTMKI
jgi:hypothetical protein